MSNLSEEEKKAIEILEKFITEHKLFNIKSADNLENNIKILLNLIEKQQVEINKEKEKNKKLQDDNIKYKNANDYLSRRATGRFINLDYIEKILFDVDGYSIGE